MVYISLARVQKGRLEHLSAENRLSWAGIVEMQTAPIKDITDK